MQRSGRIGTYELDLDLLPVRLLAEQRMGSGSEYQTQLFGDESIGKLDVDVAWGNRLHQPCSRHAGKSRLEFLRNRHWSLVASPGHLHRQGKCIVKKPGPG